MKKLNFVWFLSLLLLAGCAKENIRPTNDQSPELELRNGNGVPVPKPFKTTINVPVEELGQGTFIGFCNDQFGNFNLVDDNMRKVGVNITHLGTVFLVRAEVCLRPYLQDDPEVFPPEVYGPFLAALEAFPIPSVATTEETFVAANGKDQLTIQSTFNSYPDPDNKFRSLLEGTFEITGGTGKFEGATGGGTLTGSGSADFINPAYPYIRNLDGRITY